MARLNGNNPAHASTTPASVQPLFFYDPGKNRHTQPQQPAMKRASYPAPASAPGSGTLSCCIGMSKGKDPNDDSSYQQSYQLIPKTTAQSSRQMPQCGNATTISTTASVLEDAISSRLVSREDAEDYYSGEQVEEEFDPVRIFDSDDAYLLRCRPIMSSDGEESAPTIFGISESAYSLGGMAMAKGVGNVEASESDIPVCVTVLEPRCDSVTNTNNGQDQQLSHCCCHHPRGNWARKKETSANGPNTSHPHNPTGRNVGATKQYHANLKVVDLTKIQGRRRDSKPDQPFPCFDTPGRVFHLLRSVLNCTQSKSHPDGGLHCASPWNQMHCNNSNNNASDCKDYSADQVVALIINARSAKPRDGNCNADNEFWNDVERREFNELLNFRTGDAAPSYFLHSASQLSGGHPFNVNTRDTTPLIDGDCSSTLLLVYRHLPPRDVLCGRHPVKDETHVGCLLETYFEDAVEEGADLDIGQETPTESPRVVKHRIVSPPYLSHAHEYPGLFDSLLKRIDILRKEAETIPQWTAWPEQTHYADNTWNVFPLCYTFPANDVTQRKFIHKTCSYVPETTKLLQTLGPTLRTALFSRLNPRARLGAHTGWSDLANHVLRVHIPLIVPGGKSYDGKAGCNGDNYNTGLCGTWVDGCVETHDEGRVICFDDSKVHRAFNYSNQDRIVLIVDLARPQGLPMGTATGGHTDELDAFISGFLS